MDKLLLIDGHSILSRAFYGIPGLMTSTGIHTNAVYGFLNIMFKCIDDEGADYIAAAFDLDRSKLKRTQIYPEYKGNRRPMPEELLEQVPIIRRVLGAMNVPIFSLEGYEADDILGTLAKRASGEGIDVTILSGDRDLLQLSSDHIKICIPKTSKGRTEVFNYYPADVEREYKVTPAQFIDMKALMGDSSDNVPGLPGVGPKTASELIMRYGSIENAYEHADEVRPPRAKNALIENFDLAKLSKELVTIDTAVPIEADVRGGRTRGLYTPEALGILRELELKTLSARFASRAGAYGSDTSGPSGGASSGGIDISPLKVVEDEYLAAVVLKDAAREDLIGFTIASNGDQAVTGLTLTKDRIYVILSGESYPCSRLIADTESMIGKRIASGRRIVTPDLKEELKIINIDRNDLIYDYNIAQYLIEPGRNSYDYSSLARRFLGENLESPAELIGKNDIFDLLGMNAYEQMDLFGGAGSGKKKKKNGSEEPEAAKNKALRFIAFKTLIPFLADRPVIDKLKEDGTFGLFTDIEMPLVYTLSRMEKAGVRVDRAALNEYALKLKNEIDAKESEITGLAGEKFNINSPQQLGNILFGKLGIRGSRKTRTGYSTSADVLEKIKGEHPIVGKVLRYRALTKLYSTYAKGLNDFIAADGRIHGTFNQTIAATGRLTSTEPNLQNIPVRTEEGKEIRRVFVPEPGFIFVDADYSQVELRILAALSGDKTLIEAYENAVDIHTLTASQVFHTDAENVTHEMRRSAKAVNFGIVYGISAFGLGEGLSIGRKEASEYIDRYFETYPKVKNYLDNCVKTAKEKGFVKTYFGRIRPIPGIKSSNFAERSAGERIAMNSPIQGTAADIMKIAMNRADKALGDYRSRIVLQVHDELLIEARPEELDAVIKILKESMESAADIGVRLSVDIKWGESWYDCH